MIMATALKGSCIPLIIAADGSFAILGQRRRSLPPARFYRLILTNKTPFCATITLWMLFIALLFLIHILENNSNVYKQSYLFLAARCVSFRLSISKGKGYHQPMETALIIKVPSQL